MHEILEGLTAALENLEVSKFAQPPRANNLNTDRRDGSPMDEIINAVEVALEKLHLAELISLLTKGILVDEGKRGSIMEVGRSLDQKSDLYRTKASTKATTTTDPTTILLRLAAFGGDIEGDPVGTVKPEGVKSREPPGEREVGGAGGEAKGDPVGDKVGEVVEGETTL
ncbi:hypothetical protein L2E82_48677 [Cichorium intybus]|uniref:Uncharacterized protein n=1 Tax=Cichorium intybus TaxID=13427 RepID=A0ACB8YXT4_CICIN|nr:hypothetical protein L2E82_48677 [Cichorium intybus]